MKEEKVSYTMMPWKGTPIFTLLFHVKAPEKKSFIVTSVPHHQFVKYITEFCIYGNPHTKTFRPPSSNSVSRLD